MSLKRVLPQKRLQQCAYEEDDKLPMIRMPLSRMASELSLMPPHLRGSFLKSKGFFGSKGPGSVFKVRLPILPTVWNSTVTTGVLAQTFGIATNACAGVADWETVFAEYRIVKGVIMLNPLGSTRLADISATYGPYFVAGVNYESSMSAPTSVSQVVQLDSALFVSFIRTKPESIPFDLNRVFGEIWTNGGTYTTFAVLAAYGLLFGATALPYVAVAGWFDVEYRGLL